MAQDANALTVQNTERLASRESTECESSGASADINEKNLMNPTNPVRPIEDKRTSPNQTSQKSWRETAGVKTGLHGDEWSRTVAAGLAAYQALLSRDDVVLPTVKKEGTTNLRKSDSQ